MVKLNKIYTKTGDQGQTSLLGADRIAKTDVRIDAMGAVDELLAYCGWVLVEMTHESLNEWCAALTRVQQQLFNLGAQLAARDPNASGPRVQEKDISTLEQEMDAMLLELAPLTSFVLPGGNEVMARLHIARTVCRRAERRLWQLAQDNGLDPVLLKFVNRLSDWLFVMARAVGKKMNVAETLWQSGG